MIGIVINPVAGRRRRADPTGARRIAYARRLIDRERVDAEVVATRARGEAGALSREFVERGFDVVVACGGDGTVNEVAGPLIGTGTALGVVPSGSGDGIARSFGLEREAGAALARAISGPAMPVDVGYLGERHFLNVGGIGIDAAVAANFNESRRRGALSYVVRVPWMLWRYEPTSYEIRLDGQTRSGRHLLVAFANGREYGNHMTLAPAADPRDGWLDAVLVDAGPLWRGFWMARRLMFAPARPARGIFRTRVKTASVSGDRLSCHVDGETFEVDGLIEVRIAPGALRVSGFSGQ